MAPRWNVKDRANRRLRERPDAGIKDIEVYLRNGDRTTIHHLPEHSASTTPEGSRWMALGKRTRVSWPSVSNPGRFRLQHRNCPADADSVAGDISQQTTSHQAFNSSGTVVLGRLVSLKTDQRCVHRVSLCIGRLLLDLSPPEMAAVDLNSIE